MSFFKKHIKVISLILGTLLLFIAATTILSCIKASKVKAQIENKIFIDQHHVYAFKDGLIAEESWYPETSEISGNITAFDHEYRIVASVFSDKIEIQSKYPHGWIKTQTVYLDTNGIVQLYSYTDQKMENWKETTLEAVEILRIEMMCEHAFGESVITKVASCTEPGEGKLVCQKCGFEQTHPVYVQHDYVDKVCSVCGRRKEAEKSDIAPNTWYTHDDELYFQNCKVINVVAVNNGKAMIVTYFAICQHCHAIDDFSSLAGPEVNYDVEEIHYCEECEKPTLVKFRID